MKIAFLGDIAFFGKYNIRNNDSLYQYFSKVSELLKKFDFVVGNLETPLTTNDKTFGHKSAYIKADPENVKLLKYLNINYVNLANNHIFDFGKKGFEDTKNILNQNGIKYFGVDNKTEYIDDLDGKLALSGFCCYSTNPIGVFKNINYGVNILDYSDVETAIKTNAKNGYLNIVSIHAGEEHVNYPNYDHVRLARKLATKEPYIYYGHHPHVLQGIEQVKNSTIAYSLGNFCFDDVYTDKKSTKPLIKQSTNNRTSIILAIEIIENRVVSSRPIGIYLGDDELITGCQKAVKQLELYSQKLQTKEDSYKKYRVQLLREYLENRKKSRNLNWYIKRLKIRYYYIIKLAFKNKKLYKKHLLNKL